MTKEQFFEKWEPYVGGSNQQFRRDLDELTQAFYDNGYDAGVEDAADELTPPAPSEASE